MLFALTDILEATGGTLTGGVSAAGVSGVSTDSRTVLPDELFVPLRGERFDGHDYLAAACGRGVGIVLAERR